MALKPPYDASTARRVFRVGNVTIDELRSELRVDERPTPIDRKARMILVALLSRPKDVLSKKELLVAAWGNADVTKEGSLNTAMSNLRGALGPQGHDIIRTVKDRGYTIGLPVETWMTAADIPRLSLGLSAGIEVPSRPLWRLQGAIGLSSRVWRAVHDGTNVSWTFSFADTAARSATLRREAVASRQLNECLGEGDDWGRIVDCDLDQVPHFIARSFVADSLPAFAASGALQLLAPDQLVDLAAQIARTVARAHGVGVIHGSIRPGRVMITRTDDSRLQTQLVGFIGADAADAPPASLTSIAPAVQAGSPAEIYMAPEIKEGGPVTAASDIYALGVLLLGLVTRNLGAPVTPASVADVEDPLIQMDIAAATARDPARRMVSAAFLAEQLEHLSQRRETVCRLEAERLQRERFRRARMALGVLTVALFVVAGLAIEAWHQRTVATIERDRAEQIAAVTEDTVAALVANIANRLRARAGVRLDVLQLLLGQAEGTLERMISLTPHEASLRRLQAKGLTQFGRTFWDQDDLPRALALGLKAANIQRGLVVRDPHDTEAWADLADSEHLVGDTRMRQRDQAGALSAYQDAVSIDQRLQPVWPDRAAGKRRLARAMDLVGDAQMAQGHARLALATYQAASTMIPDPGPTSGDDGWLDDLASNQRKLGDALDALHDWAGALAIYQKAAVIRHRMLDRDPGNNGWRHDVALMESDIGDEEDYLKQWASARTAYENSLAMTQELVRSDPSNEIWQRNVAVSYADLGDVADGQGDRAGAVAAEAAANLRLNALAEHSPDDTDLQRDLSGTEMNLADGLIKNGQLADALPHALRAVQIARKLAAARPADPDLAQGVELSLGVAKRAGASP